MVGSVGLEPTLPKEQDFKSCVSAISPRAQVVYKIGVVFCTNSLACHLLLKKCTACHEPERSEWFMVPRARIELATQGFSVLRSTD